MPLQDLPVPAAGGLARRSRARSCPGPSWRRSLWGTDTFVDATAGLNTAVAKLREALGDEADRPVYVETLPKRGYRFVATVLPAPLAPEPGTQPAAQLTDKPAQGPDSATPYADARPGPRRRSMAAVAAAAVVAAIGAAWAGYARWIDDRPVRVAVVLFDNETGRPEMAPLAQALTDATVASLTAEPRLAVIGNAAVLRTSRPFRDVAAIRDALGARFIVIGQVQWRDGGVLVRTHLIRGGDQAHLWIDAFPRGAGTEADFQARVSTGVRRALMTYVP